MNALATSTNGNGVCGSDSDSNSDESLDFYQPISAVDGGDEDGGGNLPDQDSNPNFHTLANGWMENGVSSLDLSDDDIEEEENEEQKATESELAVERAFSEDERRRNSPLPPDNAVRVMEAMRLISFGGATPDWAGRVPEDQWIDRLRRLGRPSPAATADSSAINN